MDDLTDEDREISLAAGNLADACGSADRAYRQTIEGKPFDRDRIETWMAYVNEVRQAATALELALDPLYPL